MNVTDLFSSLNDYALFVPFGPTHFTEHSASSINHIITNSPTIVNDFSLFDTPIAAGHLAVTITYKFGTKDKPKIID